jgi:uncharacterized protein YfeS
MNSPTHPAKTEIQSFRNSDNPSLVLRTLKGPRWGWPITALSEWYYRPAVYVSDQESELDQVEEITITIGLRQVKVLGQNLEKVCDALEAGAGAILTEQGKRFRALAKAGEPYVDSIAVTDSDGGSPAPTDTEGGAETARE